MTGTKTTLNVTLLEENNRVLDVVTYGYDFSVPILHDSFAAAAKATKRYTHNKSLAYGTSATAAAASDNHVGYETTAAAVRAYNGTLYYRAAAAYYAAAAAHNRAARVERMTDYASAVVLQKAFIYTIGALKRKLADGSNVEVWARVLGEARTYRHECVTQGATADGMKKGAYNLLCAYEKKGFIKYESGNWRVLRGSLTSLYGDVVSFLRSFGLPVYESFADALRVLIEIVSDYSARYIITKGYSKGADGKRHLTEKKTAVDTDAQKVKGALAIQTDCDGRNLVNVAAAACTDLIVSGAAKSPAELDNLRGYVFNAIHRAIYGEKKHNVRAESGDIETKLGTKETANNADTTAARVIARETLNTLFEYIENDCTLITKTRHNYKVLLAALAYGTFKDTASLASLMNVSERRVRAMRNEFVLWAANDSTVYDMLYGTFTASGETCETTAAPRVSGMIAKRTTAAPRASVPVFDFTESPRFNWIKSAPLPFVLYWQGGTIDGANIAPYKSVKETARADYSRHFWSAYEKYKNGGGMNSTLAFWLHTAPRAFILYNQYFTK